MNKELFDKFNKFAESHYTVVSSYIRARERLDDIISRVNETIKMRADLTYNYNKDISEIELLEVQIRKDCFHQVSTRYPDPAGGTNSFVQCDICSKIIG